MHYKALEIGQAIQNRELTSSKIEINKGFWQKMTENYFFLMKKLYKYYLTPLKGQHKDNGYPQRRKGEGSWELI